MLHYTIGDYVVYDEDQMRDIVEAGLSRKHMSINGLAQRCGVHHNTISNWLNGGQSIRYSALEAMMAYLIDEEYNK